MPRKKKKNTILEQILVEDFAAEGKSLARWEGKVVFVERTVPGDVVDIFLYKNKKDWAEGYPLTYHKLSPERVTPFCEHFGDCGGCQWQMVAYKDQLKFKQQQVKDALQRIGKIPLPDFLPIIGAKDDRYYRNKLEYTFGTMRYIPEAEYTKASPSPSAGEASLNPPAGGTLEPESADSDYGNQTASLSQTTLVITDAENPPAEGREAFLRRTTDSSIWQEKVANEVLRLSFLPEMDGEISYFSFQGSRAIA